MLYYLTKFFILIKEPQTVYHPFQGGSEIADYIH